CEEYGPKAHSVFDDEYGIERTRVARTGRVPWGRGPMGWLPVRDRTRGRSREPHMKTSPPFTSSVWPVIALDRSDAKNTIAFATSASVGISPSAMLAVRLAYSSSTVVSPPMASISNNPLTGGPHIHPGTTEFTRMRYGPSSLASTWAAVRRPPLEMAYAPCSGWVFRTTIEFTKTIDPPPCSFMTGATAFASSREPQRFTSEILRHTARSASSNGVKTSGRKAQ